MGEVSKQGKKKNKKQSFNFNVRVAHLQCTLDCVYLNWICNNSHPISKVIAGCSTDSSEPPCYATLSVTKATSFFNSQQKAKTETLAPSLLDVETDARDKDRL